MYFVVEGHLCLHSKEESPALHNFHRWTEDGITDVAPGASWVQTLLQFRSNSVTFVPLCPVVILGRRAQAKAPHEQLNDLQGSPWPSDV